MCYHILFKGNKLYYLNPELKRKESRGLKDRQKMGINIRPIKIRVIMSYKIYRYLKMIKMDKMRHRFKVLNESL